MSCGTNDTWVLCLVVDSKLSSTAERELWIFGGQGCISDLLFWPGSCWERQPLAQTGLGTPALGGVEEDRRRWRNESSFCKTNPSGLRCTPTPPPTTTTTEMKKSTWAGEFQTNCIWAKYIAKVWHFAWIIFCVFPSSHWVLWGLNFLYICCCFVFWQKRSDTAVTSHRCIFVEIWNIELIPKENVL